MPSIVAQYRKTRKFSHQYEMNTDSIMIKSIENGVAEGYPLPHFPAFQKLQFNVFLWETSDPQHSLVPIVQKKREIKK